MRLLYEVLSDALTAASLASGVMTVAPQSLVSELPHLNDGIYPEEIVLVLQDQGQCFGYLTIPGDWQEQAVLSDPARNWTSLITPAELVEKSTPMLHLPRLLTARERLFVLDPPLVSGVLSFRSLDKPEAKLVLYALLTDFSISLDKVLDMCMWVEIWRRTYVDGVAAEEALLQAEDWLMDVLSHEDKERLVGDLEKFHTSLLSCASFMDKYRMLKRRLPAGLCESLVFSRGGEALFLFSKIRAVRNTLAHGGSLLGQLPTPEAYEQFIDRLIDQIPALDVVPNRIREALNHWMDHDPDHTNESLCRALRSIQLA